jgi:hypothetical protein
MRAKQWVMLGLALLIALVVVGLVRWRRDIEQTTIDPKQPFQVYRPPAAPDYSRRSAWALLPANPATWSASDPAADVFFVHPTTFNGGRDWNAPIHDPGAEAYLTRAALPNYAGPFARAGRLFAPRYRQASLFAALSLKDDARAAREFAYDDVKRAFELYLANFNRGRPIILAGVEQGGTLVERLAHDELAAHPGLKVRLAAVYVIDAAALAAEHGPGARIPACAHPGEPRCEVAWLQAYSFDQADPRHAKRRTLVWDAAGRLREAEDGALLCVNPLLGALGDHSASASHSRGAANASGLAWDASPDLIQHQVSARCVDGLLQVSSPTSPALKESGGWLDRLKEPGFNLFYADLAADAANRVEGLLKTSEFQPPAPPITTSIEVRSIPRRRVD